MSSWPGLGVFGQLSVSSRIPSSSLSAPVVVVVLGSVVVVVGSVVVVVGSVVVVVVSTVLVVVGGAVVVVVVSLHSK